MKKLVIAKIEDGKSFTESVNQALRVMRFTVHWGVKITPFELYKRRTPRTNLKNIIKDGKTYSFDWSGLSISAQRGTKISVNVGCDAEGKFTNYIVMARTKVGE